MSHPEQELITKAESLLLSYNHATSSKKRGVIREKLKRMAVEMGTAAEIWEAPRRNPEYQFNVFSKTDLVSNSEEFNLSPNQLFLKKWLSPDSDNNGVLLFHGVGVGKTCTSIQIAENFKEMFNHKVLVIVPKNLKANYKRQLFNVRTLEGDNLEQCTGNDDLQKIPDRSLLTSDVIEKKAMRLIKQQYQLVGRGEFVTKVEETGMNPEKINALFSNRVIIVDEVHNMRMSADSSEKKAPAMLKMVLEYATNVKLVLMSATPMFNEAEEILWIMDLLYTNAKVPGLQFLGKSLFNSTGLLKKKAGVVLSDFARRYVSYMRGDNPVTFPARLYPSVNKDSHVLTAAKYPAIDAYTHANIAESEQMKYTEIVGSKMSKSQQQLYMKLQDDSNDPEMIKKIQLSNIKFPMKNETDDAQFAIGDTGFDQCFDTLDKKHLCVKYKDWVLATHGAFLDEERAVEHSPKIGRLCNYVKNSEGVVVIYSRYVWAGIIPIAIALEHAGFGRFGGNHLVESGKGQPMDKRGKLGSYTILSSDEQRISPHKEADIQMVSSKENKDGSIIKVVLVSDVGSEGIDFKNIREIHIFEPWFNMNKLEQIVGRGVRNDSHKYLPEDKRNCTIFNHANMLTGKDAALESIDFRMYRVSENKQRQISQIERVLKEYSIDCSLNADVLSYKDEGGEGNTIRTSQGKLVHNFKRVDKPYSRQCDMMECSMQCKGTPKGASDEFIRPQAIQYEVDIYVKRVARLFAEHIYLTAEQIHGYMKERYPKVNDTLLANALDKLVSSKRTVYGNTKKPGFIILRQGNYIYQPFDIHDMKITVAERGQVQKAKPRHVAIQPPSNQGVVQKTDIDVGNITEELTRLLQDVRKVVMGVESVDDTLWDMVADRLSDGTVFALASVWEDRKTREHPLIKEVMKALVRAGIVHVSGSEGVEFIYMAESDQILCFYGQKWQECEAMLRKKHSAAMGAYLAKQIKNKTVDIRGFVMGQKGELKFKLLDKEKHKSAKNSRKGSVCVATTSYSIENMRGRISDVVVPETSKINEFEKLNKQCLCSIYEYWLRRMSSGGPAVLFLNKVAYSLYETLPQKN